MRLTNPLSTATAEQQAYERSVRRFVARAAEGTPLPPVSPYAGIIKGLAGTPAIPVGWLPDSQLLWVARDLAAARFGLMPGSSGSGKTRAFCALFMLLIRSALGLPFPSVGVIRDIKMALEALDPKGELAENLYAYIGAVWLEATDEQRERLASLVRVIDIDTSSGLITPLPLFDRSAGVPVPLQAELRVQGEDEGADQGSTPLSRHVRKQYYKVLGYHEAPLLYSITDRFLYDAAFRTRYMETVPDRDLRLYWASAERTIPKQTLAAVSRFVQRRVDYPETRLRLGIPPADVRRLLGTAKAARFTIGRFSALDIPSGLAMEQARMRAVDICLDGARSKREFPAQALIDEVTMLFHGTNAIEELLALAFRTLRSAKFSLVLAGQDVTNALPPSLVRTVNLNTMVTTLFRSEAVEAERVFPYVFEDDPAVVGASDAERRRSFLRHVRVLPVQAFYYHVVGSPAVQLRALDMPDPEVGTGRTRDELVEVFRTNVAVRCMVRRADAEAAIEAYEARVLGRLEVPPVEPGRVLSMHDFLDELDDDGDGDAR